MVRARILTKGGGLGGWLVQEGYMLQTSSFANAQWEIRAKIADLVGESNTELFYEKYRNNYVRKVDVDSIKSWGFNSIRLPFHYDLFAANTTPPTFLNKGFEIVDSLLSWCEVNQIYLILDMHLHPVGKVQITSAIIIQTFHRYGKVRQIKISLLKFGDKLLKDILKRMGWRLRSFNEPAWNLGTNNQPLRDLYIQNHRYS